MEGLQSIIIFLQVIIGIGGAARIVYCLIQRAANEEEKTGYNKRIKNILIFVLSAELVTTIIALVQGYFIGGGSQ